MAGFVTMPQVLQVIGQAPNKHGRSTAIEKLRAVKSLFPMFGMGGKMPPQMEEMLSKVMQDGPQSMLKNPIGALGGALQGQVGNIMGNLSGMPGMGGLSSVLGGASGLQGALGKLVGTAASMAGLPGGVGAFDINSVMGHAGLAGMGVQLPDVMSMEKVLGPVFSQGLLQDVQGTLNQIQSTVGVGSDVNSFIGQVMGHVDTINSVIDQSTAALTAGLQTTLGVSAFSIISDGLDPEGTGAGPLGDFFQAIVQPDAKAAIAAHHEQMAAEFKVLKEVPAQDLDFNLDAVGEQLLADALEEQGAK